MVQLDYDGEMGPLHGMYGSMDTELEVQRTIKRAELTAFFFLLKKVIGPIKVHVDNKCDADLWVKIWEELHLLMSKEVLVEVRWQ